MAKHVYRISRSSNVSFVCRSLTRHASKEFFISHQFLTLLNCKSKFRCPIKVRTFKKTVGPIQEF